MAIKKRKLVLTPRERKKIRLRRKIRGTDQKPRISVYRSGRHIYAQAISDDSQTTIVSAATSDKGFEGTVEKVKDLANNDSTSSKSISAAYAVGQSLAKKLKEKGLEDAVFDRNGYRYHGRVKALAEGARAGGLKF
jgi:large subunit ribosomal protein L18